MGEGDIPKEYIEGKERIWKNNNRAMKYSVIGPIMLLLAMIYPIRKGLKSKDEKLWNLQQNNPIYQEYTDNKFSLNYLRDELNRLSPQQIPNSVSEKTKKELESITKSYEDSSIINHLEKAIKSEQADSTRIVNSDEFKDCISKEMGIRKRNSMLWLLPFFPISLAYLSAFGSEWRKRRKLKALKAKYKIED